MVLYEEQSEHKFTVFVVLVFYFFAPSKNCEELLLASPCLSVRTQQLGSHWTNFHEILYLRIFLKFYREISNVIGI